MATLLLSDVHLDASRPDITAQFLAYIDEARGRFETVYILGDLFEAWVGDDDTDPHNRDVEKALKRLSDHGIKLFFQHGNRDFLIGEDFSVRTGCTLLPEKWVTHLHGRDVLMMHGDSLCTDDVEYQDFRRQVRSPEWQRQFLSLPVKQRYEMARAARDASQTHTSGKPVDILDVNADAVAAAMRSAGIDIMIHGHTHRPAVHDFSLDGTSMTRIVLGDWYDHGSVVVWDDGGFELKTLARRAETA